MSRSIILSKTSELLEDNFRLSSRAASLLLLTQAGQKLQTEWEQTMNKTRKSRATIMLYLPLLILQKLWKPNEIAKASMRKQDQKGLRPLSNSRWWMKRRLRDRLHNSQHSKMLLKARLIPPRGTRQLLWGHQLWDLCKMLLNNNPQSRERKSWR